MPSPIAHLATGHALFELLRDSSRPGVDDTSLWLLLSGYSLLPDVDAAVGRWRGDMLRYHNNVTHSVAFVLLTGVGGAALYQAWRRHGFGTVLRAALAAGAAHLFLDFWSTRRGMLLLWPLSNRRLRGPLRLFWGLKWGRRPGDPVHLLTLANELLYVFLLLGCVARWKTGR